MGRYPYWLRMALPDLPTPSKWNQFYGTFMAKVLFGFEITPT